MSGIKHELFVSFRKVKEHYDIAPQTIRNWAIQGRINFRTIKNSQRTTWLYDLSSIGKIIDPQLSGPSQVLPRILYARVSSKKQEHDLERQIKILSTEYPNDEIISDIGSGINDERRGFRKLVEKVCRNEISEIVVTFKDRLLRFGFNLFELVCKEHGVKIVVYSKENHLLDVTGDEHELNEDLLSIINVFVAKRNGRRSGLLKKDRLEKQEKINQSNVI